ncbi:transcription factor TFIIIC subunit tfc4, partial [Linderina macrospora]
MAHYNELARRFAAMYADGSADDSAGGELAAYYQSNEHLTVSMEGVEGYDYSDVNMVAELHIMRHAYEDAISAIKRGARFIQGRGNELQWERVEIEDSWDAEYNAPSADAPDGAGHELPVELRAKLGQCRLLLGQTDQAHVHLAVVDQQDISVYGDVFLDIGRSMVDVGHAQEAVGLLERLRQQPAADSPELWEPLARAYRELGSWELARMYFEQVVEARPTDIESRMFLAEVLEELKHVDRAFELIREVELIQADTARADEARKQSADARADHGIVRRVQRGRRKKSAPNNADSSTDRHIAMMRKADR